MNQEAWVLHVGGLVNTNHPTDDSDEALEKAYIIRLGDDSDLDNL